MGANVQPTNDKGRSAAVITESATEEKPIMMKREDNT